MGRGGEAFEAELNTLGRVDEIDGLAIGAVMPLTLVLNNADVPPRIYDRVGIGFRCHVKIHVQISPRKNWLIGVLMKRSLTACASLRQRVHLSGSCRDVSIADLKCLDSISLRYSKY